MCVSHLKLIKEAKESAKRDAAAQLLDVLS